MTTERPLSCLRSRRGSAPWLAFVLVAACGCGGTSRFPLRSPVTRDTDTTPFSPAPREYESPFAWDAANQTVFRPISRFFAVDPVDRAVNANALDEVPDSSWFVNRIGSVALGAAAVERGSCEGPGLDPNVPDGGWVIDKGKDNGANPGFRVNLKGGGKFMLKLDTREEPDRATGATAIASRIYHAIGYHAPCDTIAYFRPSVLSLKPGLTITNNQGKARKFDQAALEDLLAGASRRDGLVRAAASSWLPGKPLGPYTYEGRRKDDPNDAINHEDRRDLRGARLVAAWLNHFDSREQNSMDVFIPADASQKDGEGYVRHYIIDLGDSFGSVWAVDGISRYFDNAYMFDVGYVAEDFITFGAIERPWELKERNSGIFNYFSAEHFDAELWRGEYPNPAFGRMTEEDGAWMARILARFNDDLVAAAVRVGKFDARSSHVLTRILIARRDKILKRYLTRLSPIGNLASRGDALCGTDLARAARIVPANARPIAGRVYRGRDLEREGAADVDAHEDGTFCVKLDHESPEWRPGESVDARYVVVELTNGHARGPLRAHLYDLGPSQGFRLVGVERPEKMGESLPD